ncbi:cysteine-rich DPF motif domain-containing protein 1 [Patella vulgata]|uniref:cysteine-rich DPF motif domain-containing protein 1 n=1 Tax=Patella vulgata TaxID=6465 RepID=UPI00218047A9|nr:cysteine-rich DPF motif domain-containing protein 1 [Patella vulgata]
MEEEIPKQFSCDICKFKANYEYYGSKPSFVKSLLLLEEAYLMKDPFTSDAGLIILGAHCSICKKCVCLTGISEQWWFTNQGSQVQCWPRKFPQVAGRETSQGPDQETATSHLDGTQNQGLYVKKTIDNWNLPTSSQKRYMCSLFYTKRFCMECVYSNINEFPLEIQEETWRSVTSG